VPTFEPSRTFRRPVPRPHAKQVEDHEQQKGLGGGRNATLLTEWRDLLGAEPIRARQIVRKVVVGRMVFEPNPASGLYQFTGRAS
jgi:hypothetical protein